MQLTTLQILHIVIPPYKNFCCPLTLYVTFWEKVFILLQKTFIRDKMKLLKLRGVYFVYKIFD